MMIVVDRFDFAVYRGNSEVSQLWSIVSTTVYKADAGIICVRTW